jgi:hypothetical protein
MERLRLSQQYYSEKVEENTSIRLTSKRNGRGDIVSTNESAPSLTHVLSIFAYHISLFYRAQWGPDGKTSKFGLHFYDDITVKVEIRKHECNNDLEYDHVYINGISVGNRHAAINAYTRLCAPYIEKLVKGEV